MANCAEVGRAAPDAVFGQGKRTPHRLSASDAAHPAPALPGPPSPCAYRSRRRPDTRERRCPARSCSIHRADQPCQVLVVDAALEPQHAPPGQTKIDPGNRWWGRRDGNSATDVMPTGKTPPLDPGTRGPCAWDRGATRRSADGSPHGAEQPASPSRRTHQQRSRSPTCRHHPDADAARPPEFRPA